MTYGPSGGAGGPRPFVTSPQYFILYQTKLIYTGTDIEAQKLGGTRPMKSTFDNQHTYKIVASIGLRSVFVNLMDTSVVENPFQIGGKTDVTSHDLSKTDCIHVSTRCCPEGWYLIEVLRGAHSTCVFHAYVQEVWGLNAGHAVKCEDGYREGPHGF